MNYNHNTSGQKDCITSLLSGSTVTITVNIEAVSVAINFVRIFVNDIEGNFDVTTHTSVTATSYFVAAAVPWWF